MFEYLSIEDEVYYLEFSLSGEFKGKFRVGYAKIEAVDLYVVFSLPTYSKSVFIALAREVPRDVALYLANLEDYERDGAVAMRPGEVIITPKEMYSEGNSPFALILLRTSTSIDCAKIPDNSLINGILTSFILVLPLTREEYQMRRERGHDALMDAFQDSQKDIFF